jgi:cytoskeletal protein RodZ
MRTVVVLVAVAALGWLFLVQKQKETQKAATPAVTAPKQTAAAPRPVSEHNWMKRSLDRTNEVKRQVAEQRKQDGTH